MTAVRSLQPLTREQLMRAVPSAFAEHPAEGRGKNYLFIPTYQVLATLEQELGFVPTWATESKTRIEGQQPHVKHMIRLRHHDDVARPQKNTVEIVYTNDSRGTSSYRVQSGWWRQVCSNGMIAWQSDESHSLRVHHRGNNNRDDLLNNIVESTLQVVQDVPMLQDRIERMEGTPINPLDQYTLATFAHKARFGESEDEGEKTAANVFRPEDLLQLNRREDAAMTVYNTYMTLQENGITGGRAHGGISRVVNDTDENGRPRSRVHTMRPIKSIDGNVRYNTLLDQFVQALMANRSR